MPGKECGICHDTGFTVVGGVKKICVCTKFRRLAAYAPQLIGSVIKSEKQVRDEFSDIFGDDKRTYLKLRKGLNEISVDVAIAFWLLKHNMPTYRIMNVYELIEIFLQHHPTYKSMFEIKFPALILLQGYDEFPNVRQNDAILQVLEIMRRSDGLVLYISSRQDDPPEIATYLRLHNWKIINKQSGGGETTYGRI